MESLPLEVVTDATFTDRVLDADVPVVVLYWATWCAPCRQLLPIMEELAGWYRDRVRIVRIDTDAATATPQAQGVHGVPTVQLFRSGAEVARFQGARTKIELTEAIDGLLAGELSA
ncbi:thioredoxin [Raineyella antarctica]|uniref:Thioredoxin n=1 Tax=Raineyella antarctica TaxID=1577474 RepID=A0A1G6HR19_9ACTN|nr:thioredoxin domain-containing protein [Raineyella antarctica]SDB96747.1 thioredoxin [Raineyella antarctica]